MNISDETHTYIHTYIDVAVVELPESRATKISRCNSADYYLSFADEGLITVGAVKK
jgi:hypothetical protein